METKHLPPKLRRRFLEVIDFLKKKSTTRAIFVGGSIASGKADAYSDIDLLVITRGTVPYVRYYDGSLDIEIESIRIQDFRAKLKNDPSSWYAWDGYRAIYDPERIATGVRKILHAFIRGYRTDPGHLGDMYIRLRSLRQKALRPSKNRVAESILAKTILNELVDYEYAIRNRIVPRPMKLFSHASGDPKVPATTRRLIAASARGTIRTRKLIPTIDSALRNLAPIMRRYRKYFRPWKSK